MTLVFFCIPCLASAEATRHIWNSLIKVKVRNDRGGGGGERPDTKSRMTDSQRDSMRRKGLSQKRDRLNEMKGDQREKTEKTREIWKKSTGDRTDG